MQVTWQPGTKTIPLQTQEKAAVPLTRLSCSLGAERASAVPIPHFAELEHA